MMHILLFPIHSFFCKNQVYKNVETQIGQNLENILVAEIIIFLQLFLSHIMEAQNPVFVRKVNFSGLFWEQKNQDSVKILALKKIRTWNFEAGFEEKIRTCKKGWTSQTPKNFWGSTNFYPFL